MSSGERENTQRVMLGSATVDPVAPRPRPRSGVIMVREPRLSPRLCIRLTAQLSTLDGGDSSHHTITNATTLDVADGGLKLLVERPMIEGQRVVIALDLKDGRRMVCKGRLAWTSEDPTGSRWVGVAFDAVLPGFAVMVTAP